MRSGRVDGVPLQAIEAARGLGDGVPVTSPPPPRCRSDASLQFSPVVINHVFLYLLHTRAVLSTNPVPRCAVIVGAGTAGNTHTIKAASATE